MGQHDFTKIKKFGYAEYIRMMCSSKPNHEVKGLSLSFGGKHLKLFLRMKHDVIRWYNNLNHNEQCKIRTYLSTC